MKSKDQIKRKLIVIASVLKPTDDTRMFEKMGVSLARSDKYEVHIIGYPSRAKSEEHGVHFHMLLKFKRISLSRIAARLKVLKITIKVKPELLIVTTTELLGVALLIRIFFGVKIIYDIQENYWRNILFAEAFPKLIRPIIASLVRVKEWITAPLFSRFLLAEKCYVNELDFIGNKYLVIENKCKVPEGFQRKPDKNFIQLIFTGTIAESTGIAKAIELSKKLHAVEPKIRLTILGYCLQSEFLRKIEQEVSNNSFINLVGGKELVSHSAIMDAISTANFGIVYYPLSPHTKNKIPTKLYEYLTCQLPILLQEHKPWTEMCEPFEASININFEQPDIESILIKIGSRNFYSKIPSSQVRDDTNLNQDQLLPSYQLTWESEEKKLLTLINNIF